MVLRRELLRAQLVGLHDLARARARFEIAAREEHHLADHRVVGDHHRDRAEEHLEVVGQLNAAGVARVHRDERVARHLEGQLGALKIELLDSRRLSADDGQDLLCDHREDLELDAVELVKARPRARRSQALEKLGHREVIEAVGAVHDDGLACDGLAQVLGGLSLARARGALGRAAEVELQRARERTIAAVGERRDDETAL